MTQVALPVISFRNAGVCLKPFSKRNATTQEFSHWTKWQGTHLVLGMEIQLARAHLSLSLGLLCPETWVSRQPYTTAGLVLNLENKIYVDRFPITRILNNQLWSNLSPKNMGLSLCSHLHFPSNIHSLPGEISTISVCMMVLKSSNLTWWEPKDCLFIPTGSTYEHCALTISSHIF